MSICTDTHWILHHIGFSASVQPHSRVLNFIPTYTPFHRNKSRAGIYQYFMGEEIHGFGCEKHFYYPNQNRFIWGGGGVGWGGMMELFIDQLNIC
jgi:hypothetical protein